MMTGGTGFAGSHTVRRYLEAGHSVRLLVRDREKVRRVFDPQGMAIPERDVIVGDITDAGSVERAMEGCDAVFHGAALVEMKRKLAQKVLDTNRRGVELVVGGAVKRGLPSIVYVSSASVFFEPGCPPLHLDMPIAKGTTAYAQSKSQAEHAIRALQEEGAPIRVSYPTGIVGPDDPGLSDANQAVYTFFKQTGVTTSSGFQIVDVRDLAELHLRLLELEDGAARYMAAGPMLSWAETYRVLDEVTGKWLFRFPMPGFAFRALGHVGDWIKHVWDFSFPLTRDAMEYATRWPGASGERTTRELGVHFRSAHETYADTVRWLYEAGHLRARHVGRLAGK
ncbi:MAG: NAD-dependent epimerase/dehydratase family protein [Spirochaetaceae bacterium]|nr:NAD-dependent epimerase/dehydratase family protein [Myxococcales bacterium]MCB9723892.1 NAD-dependent epimerase/dehydratase family protein [Spirochaetaceae bacterium]